MMRFMKERKLDKKTRARVVSYHNVLWQAYRSNVDQCCLSILLAAEQNTCNTEVFLAPLKSFDILALYKSDYYYYYYYL